MTEFRYFFFLIYLMQGSKKPLGHKVITGYEIIRKQKYYEGVRTIED